MHQKVCFTCKVNTFLKIFENGDFFPVTEKNPSTRSICKSFSTVLTKTLKQWKGDSIDRIQDMPCMMPEIVVFENLRFRSSTLRPYPYVSVFVWKRNFFSPFSKKLGSTRSIFASFWSVHTYTMNRFENNNLPDCACLTHTCRYTRKGSARPHLE